MVDAALDPVRYATGLVAALRLGTTTQLFSLLQIGFKPKIAFGFVVSVESVQLPKKTDEGTRLPHAWW